MRWFGFLDADSSAVRVQWEGTSVHPRWPLPALLTGTYVTVTGLKVSHASAGHFLPSSCGLVSHPTA